MDWQRQTEREVRALQRIATLLMALADLAIRAAAAPLVVRCLVLFLLRHAEAVAALYTQDTAFDFGFLVELPDSDGASTPEDAMHLAQSLHALAQILLHLAALLPKELQRSESFRAGSRSRRAGLWRRRPSRPALSPGNHDPPLRPGFFFIPNRSESHRRAQSCTPGCMCWGACPIDAYNRPPRSACKEPSQ